MQPLSDKLTALQQQRLTSLVREGESLLYAAPCGGRDSSPHVVKKNSFWARLLGKKVGDNVSVSATADSFFAITAKRVILVEGDTEPREWYLMLGLIQDFKQYDNGNGDIIFEHTLNEAGERTPMGLLNIADAAKVHTLLGSAIDAAYNASPWSV